MLDAFRSFRAVLRSVRIYYGDAQRMRDMKRLYSGFVKPGDLVFDIGAHVGDRVRAFRHLGARVIAVEPQPALARTLRLLYGPDRMVTVEQAAVGREPGTIELNINLDNPTVSTASSEFIASAKGAPGWEGQRWGKRITVPVTTLDALTAQHGPPSFIKIDVEGFEAEVLAGLSRPVPALSFEFTTIQRNVAAAAIDRCGALGYASFNAALGESQTLTHAAWLTAAQIAQWIASLPDAANSGDVYAVMS